MIKGIPAVGSTVYLRNITRRNRAPESEEKIIEARVTAVGRKYIGTDFHDSKFHIDSHHEKTSYSPDYKLYLSMNELNDEKERERLIVKLRTTDFSRCSLSQLQRMEQILNESGDVK